MNNKKGFLLPSFLVYLLLFSIITIFMGNIITRLIIPSCISLKKSQSIIMLHIAADFFVRDIKNMRENIYQWKVISPHEIMWEKDGIHINWKFEQGHLERKEGIYNDSKQSWKDAKKSMVAHGLLNTLFTIEKDEKNSIVGLKLVLTSSYDPQKSLICLVALKGKNEKL